MTGYKEVSLISKKKVETSTLMNFQGWSNITKLLVLSCIESFTGWSDITQLFVLPSIESSQAAAMLYSCFGCNYYIGRVVSDVYCFAFRDTVSVRFVDVS